MNATLDIPKRREIHASIAIGVQSLFEVALEFTKIVKLFFFDERKSQCLVKFYEYFIHIKEVLGGLGPWQVAVL